MSLFLFNQPPRPDDRDNPVRWVMMAPSSKTSAFAERFDVGVYMIYGMTEIPYPFRVVDPVERRSLGPPIDDGVELRIVDANDGPVGDDEPGELVLRHTVPWAISPGYLGDAEATARVWRNDRFHAGDIFARRRNGDYYLVDRVKDSIRRRGENVSAAEVERRCSRTPT